MNDILNICRLNMMEERIADSTSQDRDSTLAAINIKRRQIMTTTKPSVVADGATKRHIAENTASDGVYPWTESEQFC